MMNHPKAIVCLVGENPLPIYLGAKQFADKMCAVILIHSKDTKIQAQRIKKQLDTELFNNVSMMDLDDPFSSNLVSKVIDSIHIKYPKACLNYTGGTKVMSAFAVKQWAKDECVFYLDEGSGSFRFGNGRDVELDNGIVNTKILCNLHGVQVQPIELHEFEKDMDDKLLNIFFEAWPKPLPGAWQDRAPFLPDEWRDFSRHSKERAGAANIRWADFKRMSGMFIGINAPTSEEEFNEGKYKSQYKFAATAWQELLVLKMIQKCGYFEFIKNTDFRINAEKFETDVLGVLNNRLYYLSCTTSAREKLVKAKAFEAMYRARQIGGGMARVAVVSFADNRVLGKVNQSLTGVPRLKVFGLSDVESWVKGQYDTLKNFLKS